MKINVPSEAEIEKLHKKTVQGEYKEKYFELVWTHSTIVKEVALLLADDLEAKDIPIKKDIVIAGALLHDIGMYRCHDEDLYDEKDAAPNIKHGIIGGKLIRAAGYPTILSRFAEVHVGTGITIENIEKEDLPLPKEDYIPITLEEELVSFADQFHTKEPNFTSFENVREKLSRFDESKGFRMDHFMKKFGLPNLTALKEKYDKWHSEYQAFFKTFN